MCRARMKGTSSCCQDEVSTVGASMGCLHIHIIVYNIAFGSTACIVRVIIDNSRSSYHGSLGAVACRNTTLRELVETTRITPEAHNFRIYTVVRSSENVR